MTCSSNETCEAGACHTIGATPSPDARSGADAGHETDAGPLADAGPVTDAGPPPLGMVLVPGGDFVMGDSVDGESDAPTGTVSVSAFFMDANLTSFAEWESVLTWAMAHGYAFDQAGQSNGADAGAVNAPTYPVQNIGWYDAARWCNARSQHAGLAPVYYSDQNLTTVFMSGDGDVYANWSASGYRLPTEAEWERAARGGLAGQRFPWGDLISESQANYYGNPYNSNAGSGFTYDEGPAGNNLTWFVNGGFMEDLGDTSPAGAFAANGYGLYDMAGNLFEWCWDWYGPYAASPRTNPHGPATGASRVVRGGGWNHYADECRTAYRGSQAPTITDAEHGFRTVLSAGP